MTIDHMMDQMVISVSKLRSILTDFLKKEIQLEADTADETRKLLNETDEFLGKILEFRNSKNRKDHL